MTLLLLVRRSLRQHALSTVVTALTVALAVGLLMSVWMVKRQAHDTFTGQAGGWDAVLGARGSKLQLVLNAIFHLEASPGNVAWDDYLTISSNRAVAAATWALDRTPLGWPCWWLALSFGLVMLGRRLLQAEQMLALAGSALLYDLGYAVFSVAAELRYYCWPIMATLIATVMFVGQWRRTPAAHRPGRTHQALAAAPLLLVTLFGLGWRWLG